MYAVQAVRRIVERHGSCEVVTPEGIVSDGHAERIARAILGPGEYTVSATKL